MVREKYGRIAGGMKLPILILSVLLLQGCMWNRMRINDPGIAQRASAIKPGVTKGAEVPRLLGAQPTMRMPGKDRHTYGYTYGDGKTGGLMLILFNFTRTSTVAETLYVEVDPANDLVTGLYIPPARELDWRFWPFGD